MSFKIAFATHAQLRLPCTDRVSIRNIANACVQQPRARRVSRRTALSAAVYSALLAAIIPDDVKAADSGTTSRKVQHAGVENGSGHAATVGDLVGIRFKSSHNGRVFDDLFETNDPYYYRVGSDSVLKVCSASALPYAVHI